MVGVREEEARQERQEPARRSTTTSVAAAALHRRLPPNRLWLTDITEHWTGEGKLYLCAVKDVYSNRIVGYSIDSRMKSRLAVAALNNAVATPRAASVAGCVRPLRQGIQFRSRKFAAGPEPPPAWSARWAGSAPPATTPPWRSLLRACCRRTSSTGSTWATREDLRIAIVTWIERTYHRRRRQDALGRLTPIEYETIMTTPATQAA